MKYTDEFICQDGIIYHVLDVTSVDFTNAYYGVKIKKMLVLEAKGDEQIITVNSHGLTESTYITSLGDAIFVLNDADIYVPKIDGKPLKYCDLSINDFEIVGLDNTYPAYNSCLVFNKRVYKLLPNIIMMPTVILNAFGEGSHQFLYTGATLKQDLKTGAVTGIDEKEFEHSWDIVVEEKKLDLNRWYNENKVKQD